MMIVKEERCAEKNRMRGIKLYLYLGRVSEIGVQKESE